MPIRKHSRRVKVFNSALLVYLYDRANERKIADSGIDLTEPGGETFRALAREGALVVYELAQDDALDVEVSVGPPLTEKERATSRWLAPQRAPLSLPSGELCIHSADSLPIGPETPTDKGAIVEVPAGQYLLTLYRANTSQLRVEGLAHKGPAEVITLEKAELDPSSAPAAPLPFVAEEPRVPWLKAYTVTGGTFEGLVVDGRGTVVTNCDREAAAQLGLRWGSGLKATLGKATHTALYLDEGTMNQYAMFHGESAKGRFPGLVGAYWWRHHGTRTEVLVLGTENAKIKPGAKIRLDVMADPIEPYDDSFVGAWTAEGGSVRGKVLCAYKEVSGPRGMLTLDEAALRSIGAQPGETLRLRIGATERPFVWYADEGKLVGAETKDLCGLLQTHWIRKDVALLVIQPPFSWDEPAESFDFPVEAGMDAVVARRKE